MAFVAFCTLSYARGLCILGISGIKMEYAHEFDRKATSHPWTEYDPCLGAETKSKLEDMLLPVSCKTTLTKTQRVVVI